MRNRQIMICPMEATPRNKPSKRTPVPARSQMKQKIPFGPPFSHAKWDFLLHLEKHPGPHGAPLPGHLPLAPPVSSPYPARGRAARTRRGTCRALRAALENAPRFPSSAPPMRSEPGPPQRKGPLREGGALGRSGGEARIRTGGKGFAGLCLTTWPLRRRYEKGRFENRPDACDGADNGARTRDPNLGKVVLYQLSHVRLRVINIRDAAGGRKEFFKDC